jgi:hypothetical protein
MISAMRSPLILLLLTAPLVAAQTPLKPWALLPQAVTSPAGPDSAQPQMTVSRQGVLLSWIERVDGRAILRFSERTAAGWTPARDVASGADWFVNWADVPSVLRLDDGSLVAHWLQKSGPGTYAYDVRLSRSTDDGRTWAPSIVPHRDGTLTEHGFVSLFRMPGVPGTVGLVWLDGRAMKGGHEGHGAAGSMSIRFTTFDRQWKQGSEISVDTRVCECCPTAAAVTSDGPIVAYRDRSAEEIRDIHVSRFEHGAWTTPSPAHADRWQINACPVNGPSLSAEGRNVALAWFTGRNDEPHAFVAFSRDAGRSFGAPVRLDDEASAGRVDVEILPDGSAAVLYIEQGGGKPRLNVRRVDRTGASSAPVTITATDVGRASGYPRMARHGDELLFAWIERAAVSQVKTAAARIPR